MIRKIFILSGTIFTVFIYAHSAHAVTEFVSTIQESGGDYATLTAWESAMTNGGIDLTAAATKVFTHGGITGSIADAASVTGATSGATGTAVHVTATQILIKSITGTFQSGEQVEVDASNYVTLSDAGDSAIATAKIDGSWTSAESATVTVDGFTTSATNYVRIYTTTDARHNGAWKTDAYRLSVTDDQALELNDDHIKVDGLQILSSLTGATIYHAIQVSNLAAGATHYISNSIIRGSRTGSAGGTAIRLTDSDGTYYIDNNIIYDFKGGSSLGIYVNGSTATAYLYNNTVYNTDLCYYGRATATAINNIAQSCGDGFVNVWHADSNYNLSELASDAPGANSKNSAAVTFEDEAGDDFHLSASDTQALDAGTDLSSDPNYAITTDVDGGTRSGSWDMGADEQGVTSNTTPTAPSSLGGSSYVDGSYVASTTPNLTFSQSDDDSGDTLRFHIQIDDNSDFSSAVVDYLSALQSQGATSFTVGQAAGSGTYTTGSEGQTLSDASYYWRVQSSDGTATSTYGTANSGSVAFIVDTTAPAPASFSTKPVATSPSQVTMEATPATDSGAGGVEYNFQETTGNTGSVSSGWQSSSGYIASNLRACTNYTYYVQVRDSLSNSSNSSSVTTKTNCLGGGLPLGQMGQISTPLLQSITTPDASTEQPEPITTTLVSDGSLIKYADNPKVYLIEHTTKRHIADEFTFISLGYQWKDIIVIPNSQTYPDGDQIIIEQIEDKTIATVTSVPDFFPDVSAPLQIGMRSNDVVILQNALKFLGFFPVDITSTGYFGPITRTAVEEFQASAGIPIIGYADEKTITTIGL